MACASRPGPDALAAALSQLRARFGERLAEGEAIRRQHGNQLSEVPNEPPDAVLFPQTTGEVADVGSHLRETPHTHHPVRRRVIVRGPYQCAVWRPLDRHLAHEADRCRSRRRSRLHRGSRRDAQRTQSASARHRPVLSDRSRRRCFARRHGRDPRLRHQCGPLRHDAGQCAGADDRAAGRQRLPHRHARAQILRRLRPHATDRWLRGYACRRHRDHAQARRHSRGDQRRRLSVSVHRGCLQCRDRNDPDRHSGRAHRADGRNSSPRLQCLLAARLARDAAPLSRIPRLGSGRARTVGALQRHCRRVRRRTVRLGYSGRRSFQALARAPRRVLGRARAAPERQGHFHRRLRADIATCRLRRRDKIGHRREPNSWRRSSAMSATAIFTCCR